MNNFEEILEKAQEGDRKAMNDLLYEYLPLINGIVYQYGRKVNKDDLREYLMFKFIENTKKFNKNRKNYKKS